MFGCRVRLVASRLLQVAVSQRTLVTDQIRIQRIYSLTFAARRQLQCNIHQLQCHRFFQSTSRILAKKKAKKSNSKAVPSNKEKQAQENLPGSVDEIINVDKLKQNFANIVSELSKEFSSKLSLRSNLGSYASIPIEIEGEKPMNLQYIAQVSMKTANTVHINLASNPQYLTAVRNALQHSSLNVNPNIDGTSIFIETRKVTREHREMLCKSAKTLGDQQKVKIRNEQNAKLKKVKAAKNLFSEDKLRDLENEILQVAKSFNKQIDDAVKHKHTELLST